MAKQQNTDQNASPAAQLRTELMKARSQKPAECRLFEPFFK
jgi:hypothetical protein